MTGDQGRQVVSLATAPPAASATTPVVCVYVELRDFPALVQGMDAHEAAAALFAFGQVVRDAVADHPEIEIRSEGDSFFCTSPSAASAAEVAISILDAADGGQGGRQLSVACAVVAVADGDQVEAYVQAAKLGGMTPSGTVLVSDSVKRQAPGLTKKLQRARSIERTEVTSERLWSIAPARAAQSRAASPAHRRLMIGSAFLAGVLILAVALGGAWLARGGFNGRLPLGPWTIGTQISTSGPRAPLGASIQSAVQMAIDETNAHGGIGGQQLALEVLDEGTFDRTDLATTSADSFVSNSSVIGMIGPLQSPHGTVDIPITNAAGLLECSPANSNPGLTKPRFGALDLRSAYPNRINYVRTFPSDDIQGPAAASFVYHAATAGIPNAGIRNKAGLGIHRALVVDDTSAGGRETADSFEAAFKALGGTTERRAMNPGATDFTSILGPLDDTSAGPWAVYFGGIGDGGAALKQAMVAAGHADDPLVSWDGLFDGSGSDDGSYINLARTAASNTYVTTASVAPAKADFTDRYRAATGTDPNPYAAAGYACAQVVIDALQQAAQKGVDAAGLRDAVRAAAVDPASRFDTAIGTFGFDANGDSTSQFVTLYQVDPGANGGAGDWVYLDQQDFGPAP